MGVATNEEVDWQPVHQGIYDDRCFPVAVEWLFVYLKLSEEKDQQK